MFVGLNAIIIALLGVVLGLVSGDHIFSDPAGVSAFVLFLLTLTIPSATYLLKDKVNLTLLIIITLFFVAELVINILFMVTPSYGVNPYWITEAVVISVFLATLLIFIASSKDPKETKEE